MIAVASVCFVSGLLIGMIAGSETSVSDRTIGEALEIIGDVYDNSRTFSFDDYEEICRRINGLRNKNDE